MKKLILLFLLLSNISWAGFDSTTNYPNGIDVNFGTFAVGDAGEVSLNIATMLPSYVITRDYHLTVTLNEDVTVLGTLIGGSPIKIQESLSFLKTDGTELFDFFVQGEGLSGSDISPNFKDTLIFRTKGIDNLGSMTMAFWDDVNDRPTLVLNQGAIGKASTFERSLQVGSAQLYTTINYTSPQGFLYADFATDTTGADLGVEDDIEAKGSIYSQETVQGVTGNFTDIILNSNKLTYTAWTTYNPVITLVGGAGNTVPEYVSNLGRWSRIGNTVFVDIDFDGDGGDEGAGSGVINISLPVVSGTSINNGDTWFPIGSYRNGTSEYILVGLLGQSSSTISLAYFNTISNISSVTGVLQNNTSRMIRSKFSYEVDD